MSCERMTSKCEVLDLLLIHVRDRQFSDQKSLLLNHLSPITTTSTVDTLVNVDSAAAEMAANLGPELQWIPSRVSVVSASPFLNRHRLPTGDDDVINQGNPDNLGGGFKTLGH